MHFWRNAALLVPLVVHSYSVPFHQLVDRPEPTSSSFLQSDIRQSYAAFNVPCQADDDAFYFSFEVLHPLQDAACGSPNLLVNGQHLEEEWSEAQSIESGNGSANISAESTLNRDNRTIELSFTNLCLASTLVGAGNSPLPAPEGDAIGITFLRIERIDGRPSLSHAGFTVSYDQLKQQIIGVSQFSTRVAEQPDLEASASQAIPHAEEDSGTAPVEAEATKLLYLQNELDALTLTVHKQESLVDNLRRPQHAETVTEIKECSDVKCVARHVFEKAKTYIHFLVVHMMPKKANLSSDLDPDCYWNHSRQARMNAVMKGEKICSEKYSEKNKDIPSGRKSAESNHAPPSIASSTSFSSSDSERLHSVLLPIGALASLLCLSCLTARLHRNCCNPRARAERAARREERETQRQYARLARRHKWRTWWNRRLGRNNRPFSSDYEEKRSLIQAQERVLEEAMQAEIQRIRGEHGDVDEEAGQIAPNGESLPPYRSRAGSGRPPSYTSQPDASTSITVAGSIATDINGGLEDAYPASEITPDSSIANLSRRNSSDTLQTENSLV